MLTAGFEPMLIKDFLHGEGFPDLHFTTVNFDDLSGVFIFYDFLLIIYSPCVC